MPARVGSLCESEGTAETPAATPSAALMTSVTPEFFLGLLLLRTWSCFIWFCLLIIFLMLIYLESKSLDTKSITDKFISARIIE